MTTLATPATARKSAKATPAASTPIPDANVRATVDLFRHASDATRLKVLLLLDADGPTSVTGLCKGLGIGQPALSHHAAILRHAGMVDANRAGKNVLYSLSDRARPLVRAARAIVAGE